jgi:hypothetical protein
MKPPHLYAFRFTHRFDLSLTSSGQYWCWVGPAYKGERLAGEYVWLWIALSASVVLTIPLYILAKDRLSVDLLRMFL